MRVQNFPLLSGTGTHKGEKGGKEKRPASKKEKRMRKAMERGIPEKNFQGYKRLLYKDLRKTMEKKGKNSPYPP